MAETLRDAMLHKWDEDVDGITELLLVFAARAQHLSHVIRPALAAGQWVVCDRFTDATFAYQGYGRELDLNKLVVLESWVQGQLQPDITLYLDVDPDIADNALLLGKDRMEVEQRDFFFACAKAIWLERRASTFRGHQCRESFVRSAS